MFNKERKIKSVDSTQVVANLNVCKPNITQEVRQGNIYIKDKSLYSKKYIDELLESNYPDSINVVGDKVIVQGDTTNFPPNLKKNETYLFTGTRENQFYKLAVKWINATTLRYDFKLLENTKHVYSDSGQATLGALFFLASEVDEDDETGTSYGALVYSNSNNNCWFNIRIGIDKDEQGNYRAAINQGCEDGKKALSDETITLRTGKTS